MGLRRSADFGSYPDIVSVHSGSFYALAYFRLIAIDGRRIDMCIAQLECGLDGIFNLSCNKVLSVRCSGNKFDLIKLTSGSLPGAFRFMSVWLLCKDLEAAQRTKSEDRHSEYARPNVISEAGDLGATRTHLLAMFALLSSLRDLLAILVNVNDLRISKAEEA